MSMCFLLVLFFVFIVEVVIMNGVELVIEIVIRELKNRKFKFKILFRISIFIIIGVKKVR